MPVNFESECCSFLNNKKIVLRWCVFFCIQPSVNDVLAPGEVCRNACILGQFCIFWTKLSFLGLCANKAIVDFMQHIKLAQFPNIFGFFSSPSYLSIRFNWSAHIRLQTSATNKKWPHKYHHLHSRLLISNTFPRSGAENPTISSFACKTT